VLVEADIGTESAALVYRTRQILPYTPDKILDVKQVPEVIGRSRSRRSVETKRGQERLATGREFFHRRIDCRLGGKEVGPPQQQLARKPDGNLPGEARQTRERLDLSRRITPEERLKSPL